MTTNNAKNKPFFKKWQFWLVAILILGVIGAITGDTNQATTPTNQTTQKQDMKKQPKGTLPSINQEKYSDKEGLVVFKELKKQGYSVTAKYINTKVPAASQELTKPFEDAKSESCSDRLGFDAYIIDNIKQDGGNITLILKNVANSNQECPAGTNKDL